VDEIFTGHSLAGVDARGKHDNIKFERISNWEYIGTFW
jgi:hypothetical protein